MNRALLCTMASALLVLAACDAPTLARPSADYDPTSLTNGQLYRWASGSTVRVWHIQPSDSTRDVFRATLAAMAAWNNMPLFKEFSLQRAASLEEANVLIVDRTTTLPISPATACPFDPRGSTGYTYFCPQGGRALRLTGANGAATNISVVIRLDVSGMSNQSIVDAVVAHELGHALGIGGHSTDSGDVMFGAPTVSLPSNRDARTLQFLLGERPVFTL